MNEVTATISRQQLTASVQQVGPSVALKSVVVATDGTRTAGAALRMVSMLSGIRPSDVTVVTVVESRVSFIVDAALDYGALTQDAVAADSMMDKVARQLGSTGLTHSPLRVAFGQPGPAIAEVAREVHASLIVIGHGHHRLLPRLLGNDTVATILPRATAPLLVVRRGAQGLPQTIVCGVDFGQSSIRALQTVEQIAAEGASLHLVHVAPVEGKFEAGWRRVYAAGVSDAFDRLRTRLSRKDIQVATHVLHGDVAQGLVDFIQGCDADLVTVGAHNRGALSKFITGSVTDALLRRLDRSMLVAPGEEAK